MNYLSISAQSDTTTVSALSLASAATTHKDLATSPDTKPSPRRRLFGPTLAAALILILAGSATARAQTATIDWSNVHQTIQGFGAYNAWSPMGSYQSLFFSTLGYSLLRASLPIDDSCTSVNSSCANGVSNVADMQYCLSHGCKVWATVSSPPADMKTNGNVDCTVVGAALIPADYGTFATYISNYVASLKTYYNISLYAVSAQNEPDTCANATNGEAFSTLSGAQLDTFVKNNLGPTLAAQGQSSTLIMMPESSVYNSFIGLTDPCMTDPSCSQYVGMTAFHDYDNAPSFSNPYSPPMWQTEVSGGSGFGPSLCGGCWDPSIANALMYARMIHDSLIGGVSAWHYFWYIDPTGGNTDAGLVNPAQSTPIAIRTYAIAQWAKFVRPGWVRVEATANPTSGVDVTAFKNPSTGDFAIVAVNENNSTRSASFSFSASSAGSVTPYVTSATMSVSPQSSVAVSSNSFTYSLPASSITTFVGSTSLPPAPANLSGRLIVQ